MKHDHQFDELVAITRVPLADLVAKCIQANGDQVQIESAIDAAAVGMAKAFQDGLQFQAESMVLDFDAIKRLERMNIPGEPQ